MRCKVCHIKIPCKTYTGIGEYEKLCYVHARERIKSKLQLFRKQYEAAVRLGLTNPQNMREIELVRSYAKL